MKTIIISIFAIILSLSIFSCSKPLGGWDDNIFLSTRYVELSELEDSVTIKTGGNFWWINGLSINGTEYYNLKFTNMQKDRYSIKKDFLYVEHRDPTTLFIKVDPNPNTQKRIIRIDLEAGNYFDNVTINQKAKSYR
ncbi:hypothetical protein SDC9_142347 [bioreactor metagenome]|uniref:Lipoprotein n=1 Tax=bioreactor metagenome TaxID=1076179 RepID=A0A645E080_9ZZZZ